MPIGRCVTADCSARSSFQPQSPQPRRRVNDGNSSGNPGASHSFGIGWISLTGIHTLVARDCSLLPPAYAGRGRPGLTVGVLVGNRVWLRNIVSIRRRTGAAALSGLL